MCEFTVATANTQLGKAVRTPGGLNGVADVDALLLQEVHSERDNLDEFLDKETDLTLACAADGLGLAIALRKSLYQTHKPREHVIQPATKSFILPKLAKYNKSITFRLRNRGALEVGTSIAGRKISIFTTHPNVPLRARSRAAHLAKLPNILDGATDIAILGGDMNHWPKPTEQDEQMRLDAHLKRVDIGRIETWHPEKSRQKSLALVAGKLGVVYGGQLDALFFRDPEYNTHPVAAEVIEIASDHSAIKTTLQIT